MDITFSCPECGGHLTCASELTGKNVSCPHFKVSIIVPRPTSPVPSAAAVTPQKAQVRELADNWSLEIWLRLVGLVLLTLTGIMAVVTLTHANWFGGVVIVFNMFVFGVVQLVFSFGWQRCWQ